MIERPIFHQYTILEEVQRFIPASSSRSLVVAKEFLDNAADEAEKTDYKVSIELENKTLRIKNKGVITEKDIISITDFSKLVSSKHLKRSYQRGAIGHGLKIALMLSDIDNRQVIINSNKKQYKITLLDRKAKSPKEVLKVEVQDDDNSLNEEATCFIIPLPEEDPNLTTYIEKFIIVNPHIEFTFNGHKYPRVHIKKPSFCDINSYTDKELAEIINEYLTSL